MPNPRHEPVRTCVGCRQEGGKRGLVRVVRLVGGGAAVDHAGKATGRGAYLHPDGVCILMARKRRALDRALGTQVQADLWVELSGQAGLPPSP